ncbi:MAG: quinolinate synthase A [Candidatus Poribacteria bacterium]|nr:MAG: quinolinate synthase A [Candidatus Poribacteria bacterium]
MYFVPIDQKYYRMPEEELVERIWAAKRQLGDRLVILGHHYQRDEVIQFADYTGDSFKLSQLAAGRKEAEFIIFCGVHFMAESADILSADHQKVILPDLKAGCHMADMAELEDVEECWYDLQSVVGDTVVPITYMNSAADLKAFVGENGGAVCTSSNARAVLEWAFAQKERALFFPDEHLGRNVGYTMGIPLEQMVVWDPRKPLGGNTKEQLRNAQIILWKGHCPVHQLFNEKHIHRLREVFPDIKILVHPECKFEVVKNADYVGSTEYIRKTIEQAEPGSKWAIGTELHLVNRLANQHPDKFIISVDPNQCLCTTMNRIDLQHLAWAIENLAQGRVVNQIVVPKEIARWALVALDRMLAIT